jgi:hypothetical protein
MTAFAFACLPFHFSLQKQSRPALHRAGLQNTTCWGVAKPSACIQNYNRDDLTKDSRQVALVGETTAGRPFCLSRPAVKNPKPRSFKVNWSGYSTKNKAKCFVAQYNSQ